MSNVPSTKELVEKFAAELATGQPVVFHVEDEEKNGMTLVHIAQQFSEPLYTLPGTAGGLIGQLFNFQNEGQIIRFIQPIPTTAPTELRNIFMTIGVLPEGMNIQVTHSTKPIRTKDTSKAYTPLYSNKNWIETMDGKLVWENCQPVMGKPSHTLFANYRLSDRTETPEQMKEWVNATYYNAVEKVPSVLV